MLKLKPRRIRRRSKDTLTPEDLVQRLGIGRNPSLRGAAAGPDPPGVPLRPSLGDSARDPQAHAERRDRKSLKSETPPR